MMGHLKFSWGINCQKSARPITKMRTEQNTSAFLASRGGKTCTHESTHMLTSILALATAAMVARLGIVKTADRRNKGNDDVGLWAMWHVMCCFFRIRPLEKKFRMSSPQVTTETTCDLLDCSPAFKRLYDPWAIMIDVTPKPFAKTFLNPRHSRHPSSVQNCTHQWWLCW